MKPYIDNNDLVQAEVLTGDGTLIGKVHDMPPLGSYGTNGDKFYFRYLGG
jgi:hypothetical protein